MIGNITRKRKLEIKIARILLKLGAEVIWKLPFCFHRCYFFSIILHIQEVPYLFLEVEKALGMRLLKVADFWEKLLMSKWLSVMTRRWTTSSDHFLHPGKDSIVNFMCTWPSKLSKIQFREVSQMIKTKPNSKKNSDEVSNHNDIKMMIMTMLKAMAILKQKWRRSSMIVVQLIWKKWQIMQRIKRLFQQVSNEP